MGTFRIEMEGVMNIEQQQQQASYGAYGVDAGFGDFSPMDTKAAPMRLPTKGYSKDNALCAVILTVHNGSSYDALFSKVKQEPPEENVSIGLWSLCYANLAPLLAAVQGKKVEEDDAEIYAEVAGDIAQAEPSSVLLNFECCSGCSDAGFPAAADVYGCVRYFLDRGFQVCFGDFATKALIGTWDVEQPGPCPLRKVGELNETFELRFNPATLVQSPNAQLAQVGELCREK